MNKRNEIFFLLIAITVIVSFLGCTTISGPADFVEYKITKGMKKSEQSSLLNESFDKYYDDEYFYDDNGNLIKMKQTEYLGKDKKNRKFFVWTTEWKVMGEAVLPYRASCNGVVYCEIDWDILVSKNKGAITSDIESKYYIEQEDSFYDSYYYFWYADLDKYPVPFMPDTKYIKKLSVFQGYYFVDKSILTLGYDNIVLKRYFYSSKKFYEGAAKTYPEGSSRNTMLKNLAKNSTIEFNYDWDVIADTICMKKMAFNAHFSKDSANFEVEMQYNANGQRTNEDWIVISKENGKEKKTKVFQQAMQY